MLCLGHFYLKRLFALNSCYKNNGSDTNNMQ